MSRSAFGALVEERCRQLNIGSQVELGALLASRGCRVSANTISAWHTGSKRPRPGRLGALCDVLQFHGAERDRVYRLALEVPDEDADEPEPVAASEVA